MINSFTWKNKIKSSISVLSVVALGLAFSLNQLNYFYKFFTSSTLIKIQVGLILLASSLIVGRFLIFFIEYKFYKGFKYGCKVLSLTKKLELKLFEANYYVRVGHKHRTPRIDVALSDNLLDGFIYVENSIKDEKKLDKANISSALNEYVVDFHGLTPDENYFVFQIINVESFTPLVFDSFEELFDYSESIPEYQLFLSRNIVFDLQHMLLVGHTGSGKTYALYNFIFQFLLHGKNINKVYELFFADPKGSSLYVLGKNLNLPKERNSRTIEEIIESLRLFNSLLEERQKELEQKLDTKLDADYRDFGLAPYIFVIDEFAAFQNTVKTFPKLERDVVNSYLSNVVLMGRQLGFFLIVVMQKSDASIINTALRDNLTFKLVLGNAENTTYETAFGTGVEIPNRDYSIGEGVFTEPKISLVPRSCIVPTLNFDLLSQFKRLKCFK